MLGIVDGLSIPRVLAGLTPHGLDHLVRPEQADDTPTVDSVKRRDFGRAALGVTLALPLAGVASGEPVDVTRLEPDEVVSDLYTLDDRYGGAAIADIARRRLASLTRQLEQASVTPSVETHLQSLVGTLATCAAWLSYDAGETKVARALDAQALYAAHLANNRDLQVEVLASTSMQAKGNDRPGEAINLAESAMRIARTADPRVRSLLAMRVAIAAAQQRDTTKFNESRRDAWRLLGGARDGERPAWFHFFDDRELMGLEALGPMQLKRHAEAACILDKVVSQQQTYLRNKAYYAAVRAEAFIGASCLEGAVATINNALPVFTEVTSARTFDRLKTVRTGLKPFAKGSAEVAECREILDSLLI